MIFGAGVMAQGVEHLYSKHETLNSNPSTTKKQHQQKKVWYSAGCSVVHACNPSYSGGRDQEDHGSKPAQANSLQDLILGKNPQKSGLAELLIVVEYMLSKCEALS
jgi:hypothetical protein